MEKYQADGAVGIKSALAYERTLQYDKVSRHEAETAFNRIASHSGEGLSWLEAKPLQDYMMHQVIWATLAKTLANMYADLCWVYIISPEIGRRLLHELIETVPGNKIMAFGGDSVL